MTVRPGPKAASTETVTVRPARIRAGTDGSGISGGGEAVRDPGAGREADAYWLRKRGSWRQKPKPR